MFAACVAMFEQSEKSEAPTPRPWARRSATAAAAGVAVRERAAAADCPGRRALLGLLGLFPGGPGGVTGERVGAIVVCGGSGGGRSGGPTIQVDFLTLWRRLCRRPLALRGHDREDVAGVTVLRSWQRVAADLTTPRGEAYAMRTAQHVETDLNRWEQRRPRVVVRTWTRWRRPPKVTSRSQEPGAEPGNPNVRLLAELVTVLTPAEQETRGSAAAARMDWISASCFAPR